MIARIRYCTVYFEKAYRVSRRPAERNIVDLSYDAWRVDKRSHHSLPHENWHTTRSATIISLSTLRDLIEQYAQRDGG